MSGFDYTGAAFLTGAIGALVASLVASALSIATFIRSGRNARAIGAVTDAITDVKHNVKTIEVATNSMKDALVKATADAEFSRGKAEGVAVERANPQVRAPVVKP